MVLRRNHSGLTNFLSVAIVLSAAHYAFAIMPAPEISMPEFATLSETIEYLNQQQATTPTSPIAMEAMQILLQAGQVEPEISELARGLKYDPDLMYQFIHDNIDYVPIWGDTKGAYMTLMDRAGNSFDQASLFIALLREAGYDETTAKYVHGTIHLTYDQLSNYWGLFDASSILTITLPGGIPFIDGEVVGEDLIYLDIEHVWVKVYIDDSENGIDDGQWYAYDPSFKEYDYTDGVSLATAMNYSQADYLSTADGVKQDAAIQNEEVQNLNTTNMETKLTTYTSNLVEYIKTEVPGATLNDIIGGRTIKPVTNLTRVTSLPHVISEIEEWGSIPSQYRVTFRIEYCGIDQSFYSSDIYGKRLTISYNTSGLPELKLDGEILDTGTTTTETYEDITMSPVDTYGNVTSDIKSLKVGGIYSIMNVWGGSQTTKIIEKHRKLLKEYTDAGYLNSSEEVVGESLMIMGLTFEAERYRYNQLAGRIGNFRDIFHHVMGIFGQHESPYINHSWTSSTVLSIDGDTSNLREYMFSRWGMGSALESGVIEQYQPDVDGISTVKILDLANSSGHKVYKATSSNWDISGGIKSKLTGYETSTLASIENHILIDGDTVVLSEYGGYDIGEKNEIGWAYYSDSGYGAGYKISNNHNGGHSGSTDPVNPVAVVEQATGIEISSIDVSDDHDQTPEPIDLVTGDYLYDHSDLNIGTGGYPFSLDFERSYNSVSETNDGVMGRGWKHNWDITAKISSNGFQSMGDDSPIDAAAAIVATYINMDLYSTETSLTNFMIITMGQKWLMDLMVDNVVTVKQPGNSMQFVRLPDGSYNPPPGKAGTLTKEPDNSFKLRTKTGNELEFDTDGFIKKWSDPQNNKVTFNYETIAIKQLSNPAPVASYHNSLDNISQVCYAVYYDNYPSPPGYWEERVLATVVPRTDYPEFGNAILLNEHDAGASGLNEYIRTTTTCTTVGDFTVSLWAKRHPLGDSGPAFSHASVPGLHWSGNYLDSKSYSLEVGSSFCFVINQYFGNCNIDDSYRCMSIDDYEWHLYTVTLDDTTMDLYVDGQFVMTGNIPDRDDYPIMYNWNHCDYNSAETYIGRIKNGYAGYIDDVRMYYTKLTDAQVGSLHPATRQYQAIPGYEWMGDDIEYKRITSVSNDYGRTLTFGYNAAGRLTSVTDDAGRSVHYSYDSDGNLETFTDADGEITTFTYDPANPGRLISIYYPANNPDMTVPPTPVNLVNAFAINEYDSLGRVKRQTNANNYTYDYYYSYYRTEEQEPAQIPPGETVEQRFSTVYYFNNHGRPIAKEDQLGNKTTTEYDGQLRKTLVTYPEDNAVMYNYDSNHNVKEIIPVPIEGSAEWPEYDGGTLITETFTYDTDPAGYNNLLSHRDKAGNITTYSYYTSGDSLGLLHQITEPVVDGQTPITTYTYYTNGQVDTVTDPKQTVTKYVYHTTGNSVGALQSVTLDYGDATHLNITTQYTYDDVGNIETETDPRDNITTYDEYDNNRRLKKKISPYPFNYETIFEYDADGNLELEGKTDNAEPTGYMDVSYTYTLSGKKETMVNPNGKTTYYEYDALDRLWVVTDVEGKVTKNLYYPNGQLWKVIDAEDNAAVTYEYYDDGLQKKLTDANTNATNYQYDGYRRLKKTIYPDNNFEEFGYDERDNIELKTTRAGDTVEFDYDELNRLKMKAIQSDNLVYKYKYDLTGVQTHIKNGLDEDLVEYIPDNIGRILRVDYPDGKYVAYEYDNAGNRIELTYPDDTFITYEYDKMNRLEYIKDMGTDIVASYTYDALSRRTGAAYENGTSVAYDFGLSTDETAGMLINVNNTTASGNLTYDYTYRDSGNKETMTVDGTDLHSYTYDNIYQLNAAVYPGSYFANDVTDYDYDLTGNRGDVVTSSSTINYTTNSLNQYTSVSSTSYFYDDNGNLISDGTNSYTYDAENRLLTAAVPAHVSITYTYDPLGRRKSKIVDGVTTTYFYDGDQVICEYDYNGLLKYKYIYGPGIDEPVRRVYISPATDISGNGIVDMADLLIMSQSWLLQSTDPGFSAASDLNRDGSIDNIDSDILSSEWNTSGAAEVVYHYYHFDGSGNVIALTDSEGYVVERYNYDVFGNVDSTGSVNNVYFFTGRRWDSETGLYYYRARMYNPTIGRFMQPDPIGYDDGPNMYVYVGNNPLYFADPYGLCKESSGIDWFQGAVDGIGVVDPTGIFDGVNAIIYLARGQWGNAGISALGLFPYIGDLGKGGKYGAKALKYSDEVVDSAKAVGGVYEFTAKSGETYVGQTNKFTRRVGQHLGTKLDPGDLKTLKVTPVSGDRLARRIAEQKRINALGGKSNLDNIRNAIRESDWVKYGIDSPKP